MKNPQATGFSQPHAVGANRLNSGGFGYFNPAITGIEVGQPRNGTLLARLPFDGQPK